MAWVDQGMDNESGLRLWFNPDTGETKYGQYNSSLAPDAFDANGTMISTGWNPNMAAPAGGFTVGQAVSPNYLNSGVDLSDPAALAAAVRDVAPKYRGPLDMNAVIPPDQMRAPAKGDAFENLLGMGAMAGLGYLSGGFGLSDLFSGFGGSPTFSGTFDPTLPGVGSGRGATGGANMWELDNWDLFGAGSNAVNPLSNLTYDPLIAYDAVAANDPVGALIKNLESGMTSSEAIKAVEAALPGTTRGALEQFLYNSGLNNVSSLSKLFGGNNTGGLSSLFGNNGSLLGAGLGGLLGMLNGTKKIDDAVTTESGYNSVLSPAAQDEMLKTIRGDYLNPDTNPYLKQTYDRAAGEIGARLSPSFGHMEAFGQNSGWQNAFGRSLADLGTSLYGGNYNQERQRQYGAASSAPNYMKRTTTPVYHNPMGGLFSGAMAGGLLGGKLFGGP